MNGQGTSSVKRRRRASLNTVGALALGAAVVHWSAESRAADGKLYVVSTAHLDTQWNWTIQNTINQYIPNTMRGQLALMDKYPKYVFSFEGAFRYGLMKEFYPDDYARVKTKIAQGQWVPTGSSMDAGDVNIPSAESLIRHTLYGNGFFQSEFGKKSKDLFLPDCFGFPYSLPTIAAHSGLLGFTTQKLTWGGWLGIPFGVGTWQGVDGSTVVAALNPGAYDSAITSDWSTDQGKVDAVRNNPAHLGYAFFGVGDQGGAPATSSVDRLMTAMNNANGTIQVVNTGADQLYRDITPQQKAVLPKLNDELIMTTHGTGCYTSQAAMKAFNAGNELAADDAERASVWASWLGVTDYPASQISAGWARFLWHQFHDDVTGTSIKAAYPFSWNDEVVARNQFDNALEYSLGGLGSALDTQVQGIPILVFNSLSLDRTDIVELPITFAGSAPKSVRVFDPQGQEVPAQWQAAASGSATGTVVFVAKVPGVSVAVFDVRPSTTASSLASELLVTDSGIENAHLKVTLDGAGDPSSIVDKTSGHEFLNGSVRLDLFDDVSTTWPAWEIRPETVASTPRRVQEQKAVRVIESGPARATIEVTRIQGGSTFVQRLQLAAGDAGDRLEWGLDVDWNTKGTLLKASFPLSGSNPSATYGMAIGAIQRPNNTSKRYEVPAQQWADLSATANDFGAAVLTHAKYGWDKPADNTLRLTLLHTPQVGNSYTEQATLDIGHHSMRYAFAPHANAWAAGAVVSRAARFNQPLQSVQVTPHPGPLGRSSSFLSVDNPQVMVKALKRAEGSDEIIVRVHETSGKDQSALLKFAAPVTSAKQVTGGEEELSTPVTIENGALRCDMTGYQIKAFAVRLGPSPITFDRDQQKPVNIPYDLDVISENANRADGNFDGAGVSLPAEQLPSTVVHNGISFQIGPRAVGQANALKSAGQTLTLDGTPEEIHILAAAVGETTGTFLVGDQPTTLTIQDWGAVVGQWGREGAPTFVKTNAIAWVANHRHAPDRDRAYELAYLFHYVLKNPSGAKTVTLPSNDKIRVLAVTQFTHGMAHGQANLADGGASAGGASAQTLPGVAAGGTGSVIGGGNAGAAGFGATGAAGAASPRGDSSPACGCHVGLRASRSPIGMGLLAGLGFWVWAGRTSVKRRAPKHIA